jgi:hypothetical protein
MRAEPGQCANPSCVCRPEGDSSCGSDQCAATLGTVTDAPCNCKHEVCVQARAMRVGPDDPLVLDNVE